ncbi:MAG: O-antigen ligase family protein [Elusimicrobiales bacterium]|nr:O-antigen ligase family protein [Elusimicrobiales bacterium]
MPAFPPAKSSPRFSAEGVIYAAALFLCPLLFFTDLTRNPYYTQIALLNVCICALAAVKLARMWRERRWLNDTAAPDLPWLLWLGACLASFAHAYFGHAAFFRPAMASEGLRVGLFTVLNCFLVYWLAKSARLSEKPFARPLGLAPLLIFWGLFWAFYPEFRSLPAESSTFQRIFDPYGAALWAAALCAAVFAARDVSFDALLHLAFAAGALAAGYGVLQTFGVEWIWPTALNPYGARAVSTFGNPNFVSSYLVMLLPFSWVYYVRQRAAGRRIFYGFLFLIYSASLLASMTRSSWLGALAAMAFLAALKEERRLALLSKKAVLAVAAPAALLVFLWPSGGTGGYHPTVIGRTAEMAGMGASLAALPKNPAKVYSPWHQRVLIWDSCLQMGFESPFIGKGWGLLELFYPFYQGPLLIASESARALRTHANNAHNELVEVFCQTGIMGLGLYLWIFAAFYFAFVQFYKTAPPDQAAIAAACAAAIAGMLADNMLNVSLHFALPGFLFWWIAGFLAALCAGKSRSAGLEWKRPALARAALIAGFCAAAGVVWIWALQWNREVEYFWGFKLARRGENALALGHLERAHSSFSREVNTEYELANIYLKNGDADKALRAYGDALKANAGYDEIFFNKAMVLFKKSGKPFEAFPLAQMSVAINPLNIQSYNLLADIALSTSTGGRLAADARRTLEAAEPVFSQNANYLNTLAYFCVLSGENGKARAYFVKGLELDPLNAMLEANIAKLDAGLKIIDDSALRRAAQIRALETAFSSGDRSPALLRRARDYALAHPEHEYGRVLVARILAARGENAEAARLLDEVLAANPDSPAGKTARAAMYAGEGRAGDAAALLRQVLEANPADPRARRLLELFSASTQ